MKKILSIFAVVTALVLTQACESKKEENNDTTVAAGDVTATSTTTLEERRARLKQERAAYAERRRLAAEERAKTSATYTDATGKTVYNKADVNPSFRGNSEELEAYIQDNINYPSSAQADKIEGTVFVDFTVGSDGAVRDAEVTEATNDEAKQNFSEEAIRVVSSMPGWTPGTQAGKKVDVRVSLPITFQLEM